MQAILIPVEGPVEQIEIADTLEVKQQLVGGYIEPLAIPHVLTKGTDPATAYVNEEGKFNGSEPNMRATDFMVPGMGITYGDVIRGPMLLLGFDPATGEHRDVPEGVVERARLIESEAG